MTNEWYIYGSSGHGRFARAFPVDGDGGYNDLFYDSPAIQSRYLKHKQYELKDHLGNVRVVVSDFKKNNNPANSNPPYRAEVLAAYNYYPFGMLQPGMYSEDNTLRYRFGFNGMLRDDDMTDKLSTGPPVDEGRGNSYSTQFRQYDPRVTRWFSNDPEKQLFPWSSPYVGLNNNPILMIDTDGDISKPAVLLEVRLAKPENTFLGILRGVRGDGIGTVAVGQDGYYVRNLNPGLYLSELPIVAFGRNYNDKSPYKEKKFEWGRDSKEDHKGEILHHIFPKQMRDDFMNKYGIDIDDPWFTEWLPEENHKGYPKHHREYNAEWENWIEKNPYAPFQDVMDQGIYLMDKHFQVKPTGYEKQSIDKKEDE